jgi:hypothetical protein
MGQVEVNNIMNSINVENTFNTIDVNNDISNILIIPQEVTNVVEILTPGPQGPPGPSGSSLTIGSFLLLASGSSSDVDGGIIVQNNINSSGNAFGYSTPENRWVLQSSLNSLSTSFSSINGYINTTQYGLLSLLPLEPSYGGSTYGYGNIYIATDTEDIFMWV